MTIFFAETSLAQSYNPDECISRTLGCVCYTQDGVNKIDNAIYDLEICRVTLAEKDLFIKKNIDTSAPKTLYYQEPSFIIGGIVVSFSVGLLIGVLAKK